MSDRLNGLLDTSLEDVLNALPGVAYVVDREGLLVACGGADWASFSAENGAGLPSDAVIGRNLFDLIEGEDVRAAYRELQRRVLDGRITLTFEYRCDAPDTERLMKMSLGPVRAHGAVAGVLYHSTLVSSVHRVPLNFLSPDLARERYRGALALPTVTICAWCADISDGAGGWMKPTEYYRRGGGDAVQLSHGICSTCHARVLESEPGESGS